MPDFYSENMARSYPFDDSRAPAPMARGSDGAAVALPCPVVVDAGFTLGPAAAWSPALAPPYLARIARAADVFQFTFQCDGAGASLSFQHARALSAPLGATSRASAWGGAGAGPPGDTPAGTSFLVTGDLAPLAPLIASGDHLTGGPGLPLDVTVVQNDRDDFVSSINLANARRTLALVPGTAAPPVAEPVYNVQARRLTGAIEIVPGTSAAVTQDTAALSLALGGEVGAGQGPPCLEVPAYPGEAPPDGGPFLSGGPGCDGVILSVNGLVGPEIAIEAGPGVTVQTGKTSGGAPQVIVSFQGGSGG